MNHALIRPSFRPAAAQLEDAARALQEARSARSLCLLDRNAVIVWAGDRFTHQTGFSAAEAIGRRGSDLLSGPDTDPAVLGRIRAALGRGEAVRGERLVMYTKDRRAYLAEYHITPVRTPAGDLLHFLCERINVGAAELGGQAVEQLREALELTLEAAPMGLWDWDVAADTVHWSDSLCRLYGLPVEAGEPRLRLDWLARVHPDDRARLDAAREAVLSGASDLYDCEFRFNHTDGRLRHAHHRGRPQRDAGGRLLRMIGVTLDVTDLRAAEAAQRAAAMLYDADPSSAAESANPATAETAATDTGAAPSAATSTTATGTATARLRPAVVTEYLAHVGHELRTPLNAILGFAQLLEATHPPGAQRDRAHRIVEAGQHMLALVDDVVELQRLGAGAARLTCGPLPLAPLLDRAVVLARAALPAYAGIRVDLHRTDLWVVADARRLLQVMVNLVTNALKYNSFGGRVDIACEGVDGDRIALHVRDTGHGLTQEQRSRLFQPFERLGAERGAAPGTGLGLVITRLLVTMMDGAIDVDSSPGWGTRFSVMLPAATAAA